MATTGTLDFKVGYTGDCSKVCITPCSEFCTGVSYTITFLSAHFTMGTVAKGGKISFKDASTGTGTIATYSWVHTKPSSPPTVTSSSALFPTVFDEIGIHTVTLTVVDTNGLSSTCTGKFKVTNVNGGLEWTAIPELNITASSFPFVVFSDASDLTGTATIKTDDQVAIGAPESTTITSMPSNIATHTFTSLSADQNFTCTYTYTADEADSDSEVVTVAAALYMDRVVTDCADELTEDNIDSINLYITTPTGTELNAIDIETVFLNNTSFDLDVDDITDLSTFGINGTWKFEVIVTKTDSATYYFNACKYIVIVCDLLCKYDKLLAAKAVIGAECENCEELKTTQILEIGMYINALKAAIACNNTAQITNLITILETLTANTNCDCD